MANQASPKRKASISPEFLTYSSEEYSTDSFTSHSSAKRQKTAKYPIFISNSQTTSPQSQIQEHQESLPPYKRTLPFRRIPPHYPQRRNPSLRSRRLKRYRSLIRQNRNRIQSSCHNGLQYQTQQQKQKQQSDSINQDPLHTYDFYIASKTPSWLYRERFYPVSLPNDYITRTPTGIRFNFMTKAELKDYRLRELARRRKEEQAWEAGVTVPVVTVNKGNQTRGESKEAFEESTEGHEKSSTANCRMQ